jgi:hypothetical protein
MRNLAAAAKREKLHQAERERSGRDNPLDTVETTVRAVRAIARGNASSTTRLVEAGEEIEILVGDRLWEQLGAGPGFGRKIQTAIGARPVDADDLRAATERAIDRVERAIRSSGCVAADGKSDWPCLLDEFPDA